MNSFRTIAANKEYTEMTRNFKRDGEGRPVNELQQVKKIMYSFLNVVCSMAAVFLAVFYMADAMSMHIGFV
jgi:Endoplasmic reticulum-based factor for assembly of V-ATPase